MMGMERRDIARTEYGCCRNGAIWLFPEGTYYLYFVVVVGGGGDAVLVERIKVRLCFLVLPAVWAYGQGKVCRYCDDDDDDDDDDGGP